MISARGTVSWEGYFTSYALRLTKLLNSALRLGQRLQTASPLNSPLIIPDLPDDFVKDDILYCYAFITQYNRLSEVSK